ncbi:hypothetical protein lerEdw1_008486 [Lerista edwardsae]|nr:hypothetical protein lerEdw1_008486 [Lerista edwardsae]
MALCRYRYRPVLPPYAVSPDFSVRPACMYVPSPIADNYGFMRESIKDRGSTIVDLSHVTVCGPKWEEKWINYVNVIHSIKPWRTAGKPFVCDRLWLWTS